MMAKAARRCDRAGLRDANVAAASGANAATGETGGINVADMAGGASSNDSTSMRLILVAAGKSQGREGVESV
jgi:hypothetical protein